MTRRHILAQAGVALGATAAAGTQASAEPKAKTSPEPFAYCLNTSTIRGQKLGIEQEIELAAKAGYDAIEPWINEIDDYVKQGGLLKDLAKRIRDHGLKVASAIGFAQWIVDDESQRAKGLEEAKRTMDLVAQLGGTHIAAPPAGATDKPGLDLFQAAKRYGALIDLGRQMGVMPQVEVWGFSKNLSRLGETVFVAVESGRRDACLLLDVYHVYKGGSDFSGIKLLGGAGMHVFHVNDYPASPPRETITDADRVYPGDGVAPLDQLFRDLRDAGFGGVLSLELFNRTYWEKDALEVVRTGLEKTRAAVHKALSG
ncbi:MAG TPA: sugar phosphate isomerase/epimerase family protein [Pirellulales bacterium]|jgi:sugar phosphate isomerase/epimerase|nr:sugar phosphate isomerase/epimerase family protein [Pirellulales bacterium]